MAKRLTPIERAIAGDPPTRQARYEKRMRDKGIIRVTAFIPATRLPEFRAMAERWRREVLGHDD